MKKRKKIRINVRNTKRKVVIRSVEPSRIWEEMPPTFTSTLDYDVIPYTKCDAKCDIAWIDFSPQRLLSTNRFSKPRMISRLPGFKKICEKWFLFRALNRQRRFFGSSYDFYPRTYLYPHDMKKFHTLENDEKKIWIFKPSKTSEGRGIRLVTIKQLEDLENKEAVVQEYVRNAFLINGYKNDIRVYVLITSLKELEIYYFRNGLVRIATEKYNVRKKNIDNPFVHITNSSINKRNTKVWEKGESKRDFTYLKKYLTENNIDYDELFLKIEELIVKTIVAIKPYGLLHYERNYQKTDRRGFHIVGFDIILVENEEKVISPVLLEINHQPSLEISMNVDVVVKELLIHDTLQLICHQMIGSESLGNFKKCEVHEKKIEKYSLYDVFSDAVIRQSFVKYLGLRGSKPLMMSSVKLVKFVREMEFQKIINIPEVHLIFLEFSTKRGKKLINFQDFLEILADFAAKLKKKRSILLSFLEIRNRLYHKLKK